MLGREKSDTPSAFQTDFRIYGIDVTPTGLLSAINPDTGIESTGSEAALTIIHHPRLAAVFQRAGQVSEPFRLAQIRVARTHYWPSDDIVEVTIDGVKQMCKVSELIRSEAGIATLYDRKVNRGSIAPLPEIAAKVMADHKVKTLVEAAKFEREIVTALKYRTDFLLDKSLSQPD